ncbi:hypothetical protein Tco_0493810 [Tanacetum coccineum]
MLRRQHKVDDQHHDMPLIYYMEGHKLHFGPREFSLITGLRFGTVSFDLHSSGELKFQNRVFPNKIGFGITNLDIIVVIEDEEIFGKLSDDDAIRLCILLALEGEHLWCHLYDEIKNLKERHGDEHYYGSFKDRNYVPTYTLRGFVFAFQLEKAHKRRKTCFMVSSIGGTTDKIVRKKWLIDHVIMELNLRLFKLEIIIQVLAHERSDRQAKLKFTDEFSSMTSDLCDSLNRMFTDMIEPTDPDKDDYLREEELRLCLEGEEKMRCEHQKLIVEENRNRLDEAKRLRLEEENMLQLEQQKKNKRKEFMNSNHCKNLLSKLAPAKRIQLCSSSEKIQPKVRHIKCNFPWNDDYIVDRNFWLKLVWLDPARKGWLTEELLLKKACPYFILIERGIPLYEARLIRELGFIHKGLPVDYTMTQTTSMKIDNNADVAFTEVILGADDETSSNDDTSSNDEISSSEDLINYHSADDVEEPLPLDIVYPHSYVASSIMGTNRTGKAHYGLRSLGPLKEEMVHVKKPYNMVKLTNIVLGLKASNSGFFPTDDEMFLEIDEVAFKIHTKGYFEYGPLSSTPFSTRVKTKRAMVIHDEGDDRKKYFVTRGRKGKEKVIEDAGICSKGNKADVTIYKRVMVNGKVKMIEDVGAVKMGKERGVVIEDGGFINDGGKETVVTKRTIGSRKMEGKNVKVESE